MDTSAGIFARLAAEGGGEATEPPTLLALLKHPLAGWAAAPSASRPPLKPAWNWRCCAARGRRRKRRPCAGFCSFVSSLASLKGDEPFAASLRPRTG